MSWFRQFFGMPSYDEDDRFRGPFSFDGPGDGFSGDPFFGPDSGFNFGGGSLFGNFNQMFAEMDEAFRQMMPYTEGHSGALREPDPANPRDSMLKIPDKEQSPDSQLVPREQPPYDPHFSERDTFTLMVPFNFFGRIFKDIPSYSSPSYHEPERLEPLPEDSNPVRREDNDLDDDANVNKLLKDPATFGSQTRQQPQVRRSYWSSSTVRIMKPDGSFEETKKYTDSSGREETTVTHSEPEAPHRQRIGFSDRRDTYSFSLPWFFKR